jgi:hypothetical protein
MALYLILLCLFALLFYSLLRINRNKAKTAIAQFALVPLLGAAILQVIYYHMHGLFRLQGMVLDQPVGDRDPRPELDAGMILHMHPKLPHPGTCPVGDCARHRFRLGNIPLELHKDFHALWQMGSRRSLHGYLGVSGRTYRTRQPHRNDRRRERSLFHRDRTVINMDGLINSYEYFELLKEKRPALPGGDRHELHPRKPSASK